LLAEGRLPASPLRPRFERVGELCPVASHPYGAGISKLAATLSDEIYAANPGAL
jgi:hypothetical protein